MECFDINKDEIVSCLRDALDKHFEIQVEDIQFVNENGWYYFCLVYMEFYHGQQEKVFMPLSLYNFESLLNFALENKRGLIKPSVRVWDSDVLECSVRYQLTENESRGRRRKR